MFFICLALNELRSIWTYFCRNQNCIEVVMFVNNSNALPRRKIDTFFVKWTKKERFHVFNIRPFCQGASGKDKSSLRFLESPSLGANIIPFMYRHRSTTQIIIRRLFDLHSISSYIIGVLWSFTDIIMG